MKGINKVIIMGNATADPQYNVTNGGHAVATLSIATNETFTDANGQKQDRAEFHRVVFWDKLADIVNQYIRKGSPLYVEGKLRTRKYNDQTGTERYITEINANEMVMLGGNNNANGGNYNNGGNNGNYSNGNGGGNYSNCGNNANGYNNGGNYSNGNNNRGYNNGGYNNTPTR
jgi:single-strand DNA-binding protein